VYVVVGLGNPGPRYSNTRHNIGFLVADALVQDNKWITSNHAETARVTLADEEVLVVKPQTYMNRSGESVQALSEEVGFTAQDVLVVYDDFLFDFGRLRLRRSGSDGGHNGLASVLECLQTEQIARLRLGIGPVPANVADVDFVLAPFADADDVAGLTERGSAATNCWLQEGIEAAMGRFNGCSSINPLA